ncbi:RusA family crossover junction endodeoxyribonuclease [Helicobacter sp.]|uniref:RusA family crossover junction endodeoxyribonuclease n=1 Tax=Helicobacter sp. TaxID=218 RepID=UPI0025BC1CB2|nr:RusA family crossover junction endodeoxyribonuclease [Helicobacter sp.]MCI5633305.1 RusA family crossover junction endodeoxyribonuclease [Helicobacter sp.]
MLITAPSPAFNSPPSVNHYWLGSGWNRYVSKRGVEFKRALALSAKASNITPTEKQVCLSVVWHKKDNRRRDIDNILKPILDALNGIAYFDDSQVSELFVKKEQGAQESLEITIKEIQ